MKVKIYGVLDPDVAAEEHERRYKQMGTEVDAAIAAGSEAQDDLRIQLLATGMIEPLSRPAAFAISVLCDERKGSAEYGRRTLPRQITRAAERAAAELAFESTEVWTSSLSPDLNYLVGKYMGELFLLAEWGPTIEPLAKLLPIAEKTHRGRLIAAARAKLGEIQTKVGVWSEGSYEELSEEDGTPIEL